MCRSPWTPWRVNSSPGCPSTASSARIRGTGSSTKASAAWSCFGRAPPPDAIGVRRPARRKLRGERVVDASSDPPTASANPASPASARAAAHSHPSSASSTKSWTTATVTSSQRRDARSRGTCSGTASPRTEPSSTSGCTPRTSRRKHFTYASPTRQRSATGRPSGRPAGRRRRTLGDERPIASAKSSGQRGSPCRSVYSAGSPSANSTRTMSSTPSESSVSTRTGLRPRSAYHRSASKASVVTRSRRARSGPPPSSCRAPTAAVSDTAEDAGEARRRRAGDRPRRAAPRPSKSYVESRTP